jgi:hypothetical protein
VRLAILETLQGSHSGLAMLALTGRVTARTIQTQPFVCDATCLVPAMLHYQHYAWCLCKHYQRSTTSEALPLLRMVLSHPQPFVKLQPKHGPLLHAQSRHVSLVSGHPHSTVPDTPAPTLPHPDTASLGNRSSPECKQRQCTQHSHISMQHCDTTKAVAHLYAFFAAASPTR